jgi:hypothetical protein
MIKAESSPKGKKTLWEKEKFSLLAISPFPTVFSKVWNCLSLHHIIPTFDDPEIESF